MCGTLPVLLDRRHPEGEKIDIYFELYLHTNPGPAESAIIGNPGGPGLGTTQLTAGALALFAQNLDVHDLLLIDDRGRGLSTTIDCEKLQHGTAPLLSTSHVEGAWQAPVPVGNFKTSGTLGGRQVAVLVPEA